MNSEPEYVMIPLGFTKRYNRILFFSLTIPTALFSMVNLKYISQDRMCPNDPHQQYGVHGTCYYEDLYPIYRSSMAMHLGTILPATLLACVQFVPRIRQRMPAVHRWMGRMCIGLSIVGTMSCFTMSRYALGASASSWAAIWALGILFLGSMGMGVYGAQMGRWEHHRAWMLRTWSYGASIITLRIVVIILAIVTPYILDPFYVAKPCAQVSYLLRNDTELVNQYPSCKMFLTGESPEAMTVVKGIFGSDMTLVEQGAFETLWLGSATWIALAIHAGLTEIYLHYTNDEHERLKKISDSRFRAKLDKAE